MDVRGKLAGLASRSEAHAFGLLVIALDSQQLPLPGRDMERLEKMSGMDTSPWERFELPRWRSSVPGYEPIGVRPFLWLRPAAEVAVPQSMSR